MKIIYSETTEKIENFDVKYVTLEKNWIYYDLLKISNQKNPKMNTSVKIMKLTNQMISKYYNHMNRKLMIRGSQRD